MSETGAFPIEHVSARENRLELRQNGDRLIVERRSRRISLVQASRFDSVAPLLAQLIDNRADEIIVHLQRRPGREDEAQSFRDWAEAARRRRLALHLIMTGVDLGEMASDHALLLAMGFDTALVVRSFRVQRPHPIERVFLDPEVAVLDEDDAQRLRDVMAAAASPIDLPRLVLPGV